MGGGMGGPVYLSPYRFPREGGKRRNCDREGIRKSRNSCESELSDARKSENQVQKDEKGNRD